MLWKCGMLDKNPVSSLFQHSTGISAHKHSMEMARDEAQLGLERAGRKIQMLPEHPCSNPEQNQPRSCGKEGEKRERETDAESPQEPAKDGGGEGGKWENKGRQWKIKQESRWSRPDPAAWLWLTCESHPSSSPSLLFPTGNNCEVSALLRSLPRLSAFLGFTEENKAAVTGTAGWEKLFKKGSKGGVHPKFPSSLALSAFLYQRPLLSLAPLPLCSFQSEIF